MVKKSKKHWAFLLAILAFVSIFLLVLVQNKPYTQEKIDLNDIESMNIGAEMPRIIYGNSEKIILHGTFGIIFYDLQKELIYERIPTNSLDDLKLLSYLVSASEDGKNIYISEIDGRIFKYDTAKKSFEITDRIDEKMFSLEEVSLHSDERYSYSVDTKHILGSQVLTLKNDFLYLQANEDWSMNSLQLVIVNAETHDKRTISFFRKGE